MISRTGFRRNRKMKKKIHHKRHEEHEGRKKGVKNLRLSSVAFVFFVVKCIWA